MRDSPSHQAESHPWCIISGPPGVTVIWNLGRSGRSLFILPFVKVYFILRGTPHTCCYFLQVVARPIAGPTLVKSEKGTTNGRPFHDFEKTAGIDRNGSPGL